MTTSRPGGRDQRPGEHGDLLDPRCPTRQLLDRIGTKWTSMTVKVLAEEAPGEVRFAELRRRIPGISQKMLSLEIPLSALRVWAETHMPEIDRNNQLADDPPPTTEPAGQATR